MEHALNRIGPYQLRQLIGSGGMGQVFSAVHERLGQEVAIKILKPDAAKDRQLVARFLQEGQALALLEHPGVVRVLGCDRLDDGTIFLAMELLKGLSLREWMRSHPGPSPSAFALALGRQIAEVMADIHAKGIVHRDLKPENVFLCPDKSIEPGYRIKLLDFGIAKVPPTVGGNQVDTRVQTTAPTFLGTATYMAPEQFRDTSTVGGRADVYALGVLLFELLAGRPPFESTELVELISLHVREDPPPLRELVPVTPGPLSAFIASMLSKAPAERPTILRCQEVLGSVWVDGEDDCPLPGLAAFTQAQSELFFGRQAEIQELVGLVQTTHAGHPRWVQLEGLGAAGKTSLVQAGLLPRLKQHSMEGAPRWRIASPLPSTPPVRSLALSLHAAYAGPHFSQSPEELEAALMTGRDALTVLVMAHTPPDCCLLLVLEQLEELFTLGEEDRLRLDGLLSTALVASEGRLRLLTTVRSDSIHQLEQLPRLARHLNEAARYSLRPLEGDSLGQAIQGMAQRAGLRLSEGLAERMVQDAMGESSRLPLLGHTLRSLWALRGGTLLTHEHYNRLGGVQGALAHQAQQFLEGLSEQERERAKWLLLEMVQVSREAPAIRRSRPRQEVLAAAGGDALAEKVLRRLCGRRSTSGSPEEQVLQLVIVEGGPAPAQQRLGLAHETLLQRVPIIAGWIEQERAKRERYADLEATAHSWEQAGRPRSNLPTGTLLEHYLQSTTTPPLQALQVRKADTHVTRFLEAASQSERRQRRIRWTLMAASALAVVAILVSVAQAVFKQQQAQARLQELIDLNEFVSEVDWDFGRRAYTLEARQQLLDRIDRAVDRLSPEDRESDVALRVIVKTFHRRSDLAFHDETLDQTAYLLEKASRLIQRGFALKHKGMEFHLGLNHSKWGKVFQARGDLEKARTYFVQAIETFERLQPQETPDDRRTIATSYSELADVELESGRAAAAVSLYDEAIKRLERNQCSLPQPSTVDCAYEQSLLAEALGSRARAAKALGHDKDAADWFSRAEKQGRMARAEDPGSTYSRWVLARILISRAELSASSKHEDVALLYQEARLLGDELHLGEQPNKRYALALADSLRGGEQLARRQGNPSNAALLHQERCKLISDFRRRDPRDPRFKSTDCP